MYTNYFQVTALVLIALISTHYFSHKRLSNVENRLFANFLALGGIYVALDLICGFFAEKGCGTRRQTAEVVFTLYYLCTVILPYMFFCYVRIITGRQKEKYKWLKTAWFVVPVGMCLAVLLNIRIRWLFDFNKNGLLTKGFFHDMIYIYIAFFALIIAYFTARYGKTAEEEIRQTIWRFLGIETGCLAVQLLTGRWLLTGFGVAAGLWLIYLTLNNPGDYTDSMTGLFDKQYFDKWIGEKIYRKDSFHLLAVDACNMKQINRIYGTSAGDQLLIQLAKGIQEITGSLQVFRVTGNSFLVVLDSLSDYEKARDEIREFLKKPFHIGKENVTLHAAICGIMNAEKMEKEDILLAYIEYMESLSQNTEETVLIQSDSRLLEGFRYEQEVEHFLRKAVEEDLFEVYYQPVYSIKKQSFITLEALSRLKHPTLGMIPPDVFIGIAEKQGLISEVGKLQLRRVCCFIKEHEYIMQNIWNVKFNLSPSELMKPGYSRVLIGIIQEYGLNPAYFQFEITETVATEYSESFCTAIEDFAEAGIHMCLDDFGSGYANLNAVLRIPFSAVKMDRSLLMNVCTDKQAALFYHSIVMTMQHMGYKVIAEGAETEEEVKLLEKWGVDMIQGYYFSKPLDKKKLLEKIS